MRPVPLTRPAPTRSIFLLLLLSCAAGAFSILVMVDPMDPRSGPNPAESSPSPAGSARPVRIDLHLAAALNWLVRHQGPDGSWESAGFPRNCRAPACPGGGSADHDVGVTALAVLALIESGSVERGDGEERTSARRGLDWLSQRRDARAGRGKFLYNHALATLAFVRAARALNDPGYRRRAQEGADFLVKARNEGRVWRYEPRSGQNDTSATGWVVDALWAARDAGAPFDADAIGRDVRTWLDSVTDADGMVGYSRRGTGSSIREGEHFDDHETLVAVGLNLRLQIGQDAGAALLTTAVQRVACDLPVWNGSGSSVDFNYWYQGTQALLQCRQSQSAVWSKWTERVVRALAGHQHPESDGCLRGSWDPCDKWGAEGGRVYATAINAITLARVSKHRSPIAVQQD